MIAKSISGAADLLHVSQPGISRTLKYMEMKLGIELFERRQSGLIPTPEANELYSEIQPLYKRLDDLDNSISRIAKIDDSYIRIGCAPSLSQSVLPRLLAAVKTRLPQVIAKVDTMSNENLADYIVGRHGDFALSTYDPNHPLILAEKSINGNIRCVVPKTHKLAKSESVTIEQITQYEIVSYYPDTFIGRVLNAKFEQLELTPKISVQVRFNPDACSMIKRGLGVGFAYVFTDDENLGPELKTLTIEDELLSTPIYLLRHQGHSYPNFIRKYYDEITAELDKLE